MSETGNSEANNEPAEQPLARRPGRPKGMPRPPGAGRKKGTPNRVTADVRAAAQRYSRKALLTLAKLLNDPDPRVKATAARELLDRAHGKPMTPTELTGRDGAPLNPTSEKMSDLELAQHLCFALAKGSKAADDLARRSPNVVPIARKESTDDAA